MSIPESVSLIESDVKSRRGIFIEDECLDESKKRLNEKIRDKYYDILENLNLSREDACNNVDALNNLFIELNDAKCKIEGLMDCVQFNATLNVSKISPHIDGKFLDKCAGVIRSACGAVVVWWEKGGSEDDCAKLLRRLQDEFFAYLPGKFYLGVPNDVGGDHTYRYIDFWLEDVKCAFQIRIPQDYSRLTCLPVTTTSASEYFSGIQVGICSSANDGWIKEWVYGTGFDDAAQKLAELLKSDNCICNTVPKTWSRDEWMKNKDLVWSRKMDEWKDCFEFWDMIAEKHGITFSKKS